MSASPLDVLQAFVGSPKPTRTAATLILLRDGVLGVEVLLTRRSGGAGFMAGATVFPGGKVDAGDAELGPAPSASARVDDLRAAQSSRATDPADEAAAGPSAAAFFGAAVRELCEEAGVVLARDRTTGEAIAVDQAQAIARAVAGERRGHRVPTGAFARALAAAGALADLGGVVPCAWWLTPKVEPVRFDTLFFAAALPEGQEATVDGVEGVAAGFYRPAAALADHRVNGPIALPPPTLHTLERLVTLEPSLPGRGGAKAMCQALADAGLGERLLPHFVAMTQAGPTLAMPDDPLHPAALPSDHARVNRFVLRGGRFDRIQRDARL